MLSRAIVDSLPEGVVVFDGGGRCVHFGPYMEMLTGWKAEDVQGRALEEMQGGPMFHDLERRYAIALAGESVETGDTSVHSPVTGREVWVHARYAPLRGPAGEVLGVIVLVCDITRRKQVQASLEASEASYRYLFDHGPEPMWLHDEETHGFLIVNDAAVRHYGYSREEFLGMRVEDILAPEDTMPEGATGSGRVGRHRRRDGGWFDAEVTVLPMSYRGGNAVLVSAKDVTDQRHAEEQLRHSEERYRQLVELSPDGVFVVADGAVVFANPSGMKMFGAEQPGQVLGKPLLEFVHPERVELVRDRMEQLVVRGLSVPPAEERFVRLDGTEVEVDVLVTPLWLQDRRAVLVLARDITVRKRLEHELRRSHSNFQSIFQASPAATSIVTLPDGRLVDVNESFARMSGYAREELVGRTAQEAGLWIHTSQGQAILERTWSRGQARNVELALRTRSGAIRELLISAEALQLDQGPCALWIALDVTEYKLLEEQLRHAQKMEAISQLAGGLAHNFNNILSVIQVNANLVKSRESLSPRGKESLELLLKAGSQGANLVRQMLTLSRKQPLQPSVLDLNELIQGLMPMLRQVLTDSVALDLRCTCPLPTVVGDRSLLEQVLLNLVLNARDAMPRGGRLAISTDARESRRPAGAQESREPMGRYVCLTVQDSGEGIPPEVLPRLFEPFFTTKSPGKGTGLGLATVHGIIQQHRGWIEVESQAGQGTTFTIFLSIAEIRGANTADGQAADVGVPGAAQESGSS